MGTGYTWQYYDLVLLGIFLSVALGALVGFATSVPATVAVSAFSVLAIAVLLHGLFVNGPVDEPGDLTDEVDGLN